MLVYERVLNKAIETVDLPMKIIYFLPIEMAKIICP